MEEREQTQQPDGQRDEGSVASPVTLIDPAQVTLPLAVLWLELVLKLATGGGLFPQLLFIALFSIAAGQVIYLLSSLSPSQHANRIIRLVLLVLLSVIFGVEYFVYRSFRVFYDLVTILSGAGGMAKGFGGQTVSAVVNPTGLLMVGLFLVPVICYLWLRWPWHDKTRGNVAGRDYPRDLGTPATSYQRRASLAVTIGTHLAALAVVAVSGSFGRTYTDRYSFPTCIDHFGLVTSLRKEATALLFGGTHGTSFGDESHAQSLATRVATGIVDGADAVDRATTGKKPEASSAKNVLDIDFAALATTTDNEDWANLDSYVVAQAASTQNEMTGRFKGYNLIFVSAEAFSAEAIRKDLTPTLYRMATKGIQFTDYYQPASAGTTGGEYENVFGMLPTDGGASFKDTADHNNSLTIGWALNALGYEGWAFHNNDYTYYDRDITHNQLGYNHGFMGLGNGMEKWVESSWPESDLDMVRGTFDELYGSKEPFDVYYMSVSGHSLYDFSSNDMAIKWKDEVAKVDASESVRAYLACNIDLDRAMGYLIDQLEAKGLAERTVIVIAADHFPYGLDGDGPLGDLPYLSELYGYEVTTTLQRDHNRLIIWSGSLEKEKPHVVSTPTSSLDILPTLLNLFGVPWDSRLLPGRDVFSDRSPLVFNLLYDWKTELGTYTGATGKFEPVEGAKVPEGYIDRMNTVVANKINYCTAVLDTDYYRHVFGPPADVDTVHAAGKKRSDSEVKAVRDKVRASVKGLLAS